MGVGCMMMIMVAAVVSVYEVGRVLSKWTVSFCAWCIVSVIPVYLLPALLVHRQELLKSPGPILAKVLLGTAR